MSYIGSDGKTHVSLSEAASGHAAKTTASRDAQGNIVGSSIGSNYVRQQEAEKAAQAATPQPSSTTFGFYQQQDPLAAAKQAVAQAGPAPSNFTPVTNQLSSGHSTAGSVMEKARSIGESAVGSISSALGSIARPAAAQSTQKLQSQNQLSPTDMARARSIFGADRGLIQRDTAGNLAIVAEKKTFNDKQPFKSVDQLNMEKRDAEIEKFKTEHPSAIARFAADLYGATADKAALQRTEQRGNDWFAGNVTEKVLPTQEGIATWRDAKLEKVGLKEAHQAALQTVNNNPLGKAVGDVTLNTYDFVREKPVSATKEVAIIAAEDYAAGVVLGGVAIAGRVGLGTAGKMVTKVPVVGEVASSLLTKSARYVEPGMNAGLVGALGHDAYNDAKKGDYESVVKTAGSMIIGTPGYKAGSRVALKGVDIMRTKGLTEYSAESLVSKEVLTGKSMVPTTEQGTTPEGFIKGFETNGASKGYHATPSAFPKQTAALDAPGRGTDVPGLYITPESAGVNIHFTRVAKAESSYKPLVEGFSDVVYGIAHGKSYPIKEGVKQIGDALIGTPEPLEPTILHVELPSKVERLPENLRYGLDRQNIEASREYIRSEAGTGKTFLTPKLETGLASGGRAETEAVVTPESILTKMNSEGFVKFEGRRIRIDAFKVSAAAKEGTTEKTKLFSDSVEAGKADSRYDYESIGKEGLVTKAGKTVSPFSSEPQLNSMLSITPKSSESVMGYSADNVLSSPIKGTPVSDSFYSNNYKSQETALATKMIASVSGAEYKSTPKKAYEDRYSRLPENTSDVISVNPSETVIGYPAGKSWGKPLASHIDGIADISNPFASTPQSTIIPPTPRNSVIIPPPKNNPIVPPPSSFRMDGIIIIPPEKKISDDSDNIKQPKPKKDAYGKRKKQMKNVFGSWEQYNAAMNRVSRNKGLKAKNPEDLVKGTRVDIGSTGKLKLKW